MSLFAVLFILLVCIQAAVDIYSRNEFYDNVSASQENEKKKPKYLIFIEIEDKKLYLLKDGVCIRKYPIASGRPDMPSPIGSWKIISKGDWGEGFGGRWMGLNVPWGKYGIHGTTQEHTIGSNASHGCIRMFNRHIRELYNMVPHGTPVVIVNGVFGPFGTGFRDIKIGARGADVMAVQIRLKKLGFFKGYASGIYNDDLKHALHAFQKSKGLPVKDTITEQDLTAMGFREFE